MTSAVKEFSVKVSAVRHTPLIATLSPKWMSSKILLPPKVILLETLPFFMLKTVPTSSMIPVNILHHLS
jgi:hypothetical protein